MCFNMEGYIYQVAMAKIILGAVIQYNWFATSDILTILWKWLVDTSTVTFHRGIKLEMVEFF